MLHKSVKYFVLILLLNSLLAAQVDIPSWPDARGEYFKHSDKYEVQIKQGPGGEFLPVTVLMSNSQDDKIFHDSPGTYKNRTFNHAPFSFDPGGGEIYVRVKKLFSEETVAADLSNIEIINSDSGIVKIDDHTIEFKLENPKYVMVFFRTTDNFNKLSKPLVIKHMMMIFADPYEDLTEPEGDGKLIYNDSASLAEISAADILVFRQGYHDLNSRFGLNPIKVKSGSSVYIASGAVVDGFLASTDNSSGNVTVYGRGMLYYGNYYYEWPDNPIHSDGIRLHGSNNTVRGVIMADTYRHGIVPGGSATIEYVKLWGWHYNCDGFRPWNGNTRVNNNFIRACDDVLYATEMVARNNVIWQAYNGAIVACGWGNSYDTGGILLENTIVLYPEWRGRGNNNGLIATQLGDRHQCTGATIRNMEVYGDFILMNLKPSSKTENREGSGGGIHNIRLENIKIHGEFIEPARLESDPGEFTVRDVVLKNVQLMTYADRNFRQEDRTNSDLFIGNNLDDDNYFKIIDTDIPTVSFEQLKQGSAFLESEEIVVKAIAEDLDGIVKNVKLFVDDNLVRAATEAPYIWNDAGQDPALNSLSIGIHSLKLVVEDDEGDTSESIIEIEIYNDPVPAPWNAIDIGEPDISGLGRYSNDRFIIRSGSSEIYNNHDQFHYIYQPWIGDVEIIGSIENFDFEDRYSMVGFMIREDLDPNSRHVSTLLLSDYGYSFRFRVSKGGSTFHRLDNSDPVVYLPTWIRLAKSGNIFSASKSYNGSDWFEINSREFEYPDSVYVGIAIASNIIDKSVNAQIGNFTLSSVVDIGESYQYIPEKYKLHTNYPNPFNPSTKISFELPEKSIVDLTLYNSLGQKVEILVSGEHAPGKYTLSYNASHLASGIYFLRLNSGNYSSTIKLMLQK